MKPVNLYEYLSANAYPGRGIVVAKTPHGGQIRVGYFIMGRSANSRNRVFVQTPDGIKTEAFDPAKMSDPSLIIYRPVVIMDDRMIITNGDQTDTIASFLKEGKTFEEALRTRSFEPDDPNFTPRISALIDKDGCRMSIIKSADGSGKALQRYFFDYDELPPGEGRIIHTYMSDGEPLPSFAGEPVRLTLEREPFGTFSDKLWQALNRDNRVSLYTALIDRETEDVRAMIFNANN